MWIGLTHTSEGRMAAPSREILEYARDVAAKVVDGASNDLRVDLEIIIWMFGSGFVVAWRRARGLIRSIS